MQINLSTYQLFCSEQLLVCLVLGLGLSPLVVVLGESDAISLPNSFEILGPAFRCEVDYDVVSQAALTGFGFESEFLGLALSSTSHNRGHSQIILPLIEHCDLTEATWMIRVSIVALEHFTKLLLLLFVFLSLIRHY